MQAGPWRSETCNTSTAGQDWASCLVSWLGYTSQLSGQVCNYSNHFLLYWTAKKRLAINIPRSRRKSIADRLRLWQHKPAPHLFQPLAVVMAGDATATTQRQNPRPAGSHVCWWFIDSLLPPSQPWCFGPRLLVMWRRCRQRWIEGIKHWCYHFTGTQSMNISGENKGNCQTRRDMVTFGGDMWSSP